jgi:hypothetical protein
MLRLDPEFHLGQQLSVQHYDVLLKIELKGTMQCNCSFLETRKDIAFVLQLWRDARLSYTNC